MIDTIAAALILLAGPAAPANTPTPVAACVIETEPGSGQFIPCPPAPTDNSGAPAAGRSSAPAYGTDPRPDRFYSVYTDTDGDGDKEWKGSTGKSYSEAKDAATA